MDIRAIIFGLFVVLPLAACDENCGRGNEELVAGLRKSTVEHWQRRTGAEMDSEDLCFVICANETPQSNRKYEDCRDLKLDGGTAGAPGTGGQTGAGGASGAGGSYGPIPVEGEPTYSVVCITGPIEDCGKLIR